MFFRHPCEPKPERPPVPFPISPLGIHFTPIILRCSMMGMKIDFLIENPDYDKWKPRNECISKWIEIEKEVTQIQLSEFNLSPVWVLEITSTYLFKDSRKMLNNISDRGYILFERESDREKAARLYNFYGALKFVFMRSASTHGISYEISNEIADKWIEYFRTNYDRFKSLHNFTDFFSTKTLLMTKDFVGDRNYEIKDAKDFNLDEIFDSYSCGSYCSFHRPMFQVSEILSHYAQHLFCPDIPPRKVLPKMAERLKNNNAG